MFVIFRVVNCTCNPADHPFCSGGALFDAVAKRGVKVRIYYLHYSIGAVSYWNCDWGVVFVSLL